MAKTNHRALYGPSISMKSDFIQNLLKGKAPESLNEFNGKNGALFSTYTLEEFILKEARHDDYTLSAKANRSIRTFSSGEQRKALLNHLLSTKPDFLILDSIFDMLDVQSKENLVQRLIKLSEKIAIIQVVKRKDNLLPFIKNALRIEDKKITFCGTIEAYTLKYSKENELELKETLPSPLNEIQTINNPLIEFKNVRVNYGDKPIVKDINWTINAGDFWQLMGPNGSGKTTLLTMITGDNPKAYGQDITLFGHKRGTGESIWEIKKNIGYVTPAMITLFRGWNTVEKMVISGLVDSIGLYKKPTAMQKQVAGEWIKLIGLEEQKLARFSSLNEGQQCMVLIARSMIKHPNLLILDEPSHGLDDYNASLLSALINKIATEGQTTIIYVSHRNEPGLIPKQIFELVPGESGSLGREL
jgi:molybdate transport system ATP-binding protein